MSTFYYNPRNREIDFDFVALRACVRACVRSCVSAYEVDVFSEARGAGSSRWWGARRARARGAAPRKPSSAIRCSFRMFDRWCNLCG